MKIRINVQQYPLSILWKLRGSIFRTAIKPRKVLNFVRCLFSRMLKGERVASLPYTLLIEPSSYCNLKCPMCARNYMVSRKKPGNMPVDSFSTLIDEIGDHLFFVLFFGYGEPLLNPNLFDMIRIAKNKDLFVILGTNATLFDEEKIDRMLDTPPDLLVISLDATNKKRYDQIRVGGDFNKVIKNIRYLADQRKARGLKTPIIEVQFLAMKGNESDLSGADQFVNDIGGDKCSIKKVSSYYTDNSGKKIADFLPERRELSYSIYCMNSATANDFCSFPWKQVTVNWNGNVVPCCKDIDECHVFGNVFETNGAKKIWNSRSIVSFRAKIKKDIDAIDICKGCNRRVEREVFLQ